MENTIGAKLQQLIKDHEQTNVKAAEAIGVSASLISDIINDKKKQGICTGIVKKICEHYHVSSDWLLGITPCSDERKDLEAALRITGLSNRAIEILKQLKKNGLDFELAEFSPYYTERMVVIDAIISDDVLLNALCNYFCGSAAWMGDDEFLMHFASIYSRDSIDSYSSPTAKEKAMNELVDAINMQRLQAALRDFHRRNSKEILHQKGE